MFTYRKITLAKGGVRTVNQKITPLFISILTVTVDALRAQKLWLRLQPPRARVEVKKARNEDIERATSQGHPASLQLCNNKC